MRRAAWQSVLSGADAGITYGANGIWNWYKKGMPVNPTEYEIPIVYGNNEIGFLPNESMTLDAAFSGLNSVAGDVVKSKDGSSSYTGTIWRGSLNTLIPGQGYIYQSKATENKTFTFPTNAK